MRTHYAEIVFLHLLRSAGDVVHLTKSTSQNTDALFFMLGWPGVVCIKSASGYVISNLCFCIRWDL
jgi:hypothetical protein